jgi:hypothetical protein
MLFFSGNCIPPVKIKLHCTGVHNISDMNNNQTNHIIKILLADSCFTAFKNTPYAPWANWASSHIRTLIMETESVSEALLYLNYLMHLSACEDVTECDHCASSKTI